MSTFEILIRACKCQLELGLQVVLLKLEHSCGAIYSVQPDQILRQVVRIY